MFQEIETLKIFVIFQETELPYNSENRNPKKLLIFQEVTFGAQKKFLYFWEMELSSLNVRNFKAPS